MVRQARSEATRQKIIDSAVDLINEIGYPAAGLADIIERAELTKGALYYHFDSKEALATAIIEDGGTRMLERVSGGVQGGLACRWRTSFTACSWSRHHPQRQTRPGRLATCCGRSAASTPPPRAPTPCFVAEMISSVKTAVAEGDLRADIDPEVIGRAIVGVPARGRNALHRACLMARISASRSPRRGKCCSRRSCRRTR